LNSSNNDSEVSFTHPTATSSPTKNIEMKRNDLPLWILVLNCQSIKSQDKPAQLSNITTSSQADIAIGTDSTCTVTKESLIYTSQQKKRYKDIFEIYFNAKTKIIVYYHLRQCVHKTTESWHRRSCENSNFQNGKLFTFNDSTINDRNWFKCVIRSLKIQSWDGNWLSGIFP
jgi:hypothetical protein